MTKRVSERKKALTEGKKEIAIVVLLILLEVFFFMFLFSFFPIDVLASVGEDNVSVVSSVNIGNSFPEIVNITINGGNNIDLTPNATTIVNVVTIIRDYNGESDIDSVSSEFFDNVASLYGGTDDNNEHYTNNSCVIDTSYGDSTEVNATCTFEVEYYANNATWNATVFVNDSLGSETTGSSVMTISALLALGLPDSINYGEINATAVSGEQEANVTNFGNVQMNLSLSGYAVTVGDGFAMNCTAGFTQNITINYEKYNLTISQSGAMNLTQFESNYTNLTSSVVVNEFNLNYRQNDANPYVDDTNSTYWRIYVPLGVAGTCSGNIVFGAVQGGAS